jgi:hypothetical protein
MEEMMKKENIFKVTLRGLPLPTVFVKACNEAHAERIASNWGEVLAVTFACEDNLN